MNKKKLQKTAEDLINKYWGIYLGSIFLLLIIIGYFVVTLRQGDISSEYYSQTNIRQEVPTYTGTFRAPSITATNAVVWDVRAGRALYEKKSAVPQPLASLTKVMAALIAAERVPKNTTITVDYNALLQDGDSGLIAGERWKLADLLDFSLIESSNDGIAAVASAVGAISSGLPNERDVGRVSFIDLMNKKAENLGLTQTSFVNESGLDIYNETEAGAYGSATDVAKLFSYVLTTYPYLFEATTQHTALFESLSGNTHIAKNTNAALADIPALIGSKTGYTDISGGNLGIIVDPGIDYPIVIVVLGSTFENRFTDVVALSEATLDFFASAQKSY